MKRTTSEIIASHLELRRAKKVDQDLEDNFDSRVVLLTMDGEFSGHDGVRHSSQLLQQRAGDSATYNYLHQAFHEDTAFLVWSATMDDKVVCQGADSFVVKNGKIVVQTIYYLY